MEIKLFAWKSDTKQYPYTFGFTPPPKSDSGQELILKNVVVEVPGDCHRSTHKGAEVLVFPGDLRLDGNGVVGVAQFETNGCRIISQSNQQFPFAPNDEDDRR